MKWLQYVETLRKEKSDRDIYIIALQTNLMSTKEELEEVRKKNANLQNKNEELHKVIDEVSADYKKKKCESLRLNERILRQGDEIKKAEQARRQIREYQFQNMKLREERDTANEELGELRKWTGALKTSFDIVELEKEKTLTNHSEIIADYGSVQDELMRCKEEMNEVQSLAADLRERVRHLEHDRQAYKKQRDRALAVRRGAVLDRDKAFLERDQAAKKYNELKGDREEKIENSIMQLKCYDEIVARNDVMEDEVEQVKIKLREKERELEEMKLKYGLEDNNGIVQVIMEIIHSQSFVITSSRRLCFLSVSVCLFQPVCLFACLLVCLFVCLLACLFVCLFVCLLVCLFVCLFVCLLVCLFACLFVCLFAVRMVRMGIDVLYMLL